MSSAAEVLDYAPPQPAPERPVPPAPPAQSAGRFSFLRKNKFALADQVLISGANFAVGVITARALDRGEFGTFQMVFGVLLFANIIQSTLVTQAHNVLGATRVGDDYRRYTRSTLFGQLIVLAVEVLICLPVVALAYFKGWTSFAMLVVLVPTICCWQAQEFARRVMYTEGRYAGAFVNDLIAYGGQTLILAAMYAAQLQGKYHMTGSLALAAVCAACAAAAIAGILRIPALVWPVRAGMTADLKENWHFGKWLAGGELMAWASSLHMQAWWAALLIGVTASADLRAAQILFGPARVISFFLGTVLPIRFARQLAASGPHGLHGNVKRVYAGLIPVVGVYCVLLAAFPGPLLKLVYGPQYAQGESATVLMLFSVSAFLGYLQMVIVAALTAARRTHTIFAASAWGCGVALVLSPILIRQFGAVGGILSMIATLLFATVLLGRSYFKHVYSPSAVAPVAVGPVIGDGGKEPA